MCPGRESNPLKTDLQSVTLAALSPGPRRPNPAKGMKVPMTHASVVLSGITPLRKRIDKSLLKRA